MSKIARYAGNLLAFGSNAQGLERTVFGGTAQADDLTSQVTNAFLRGWGIVGPSENPSLEDFNAAFYTLSQLISYQHQMGVPEWDAQQEYYVGSTCSYGGEIYLSLSDNNIGNKPPSAQWTLSITAKNGASKLGLGTAASRNIGSGANQVPDMSLFPFSNADYGYFKLPNGIIFQWRTLTIGPASSPNMRTSSAGWAINFPNAVLGAVCSLANVTSYDTTKQGFVSSSTTTSGFTVGTGYTASNSTITIFAIGY